MGLGLTKALKKARGFLSNEVKDAVILCESLNFLHYNMKAFGVMVLPLQFVRLTASRYRANSLFIGLLRPPLILRKLVPERNSKNFNFS